MNVVFRCDASYQIGTGHVMRCLTLADALTEVGATCQFICRQHDGHLAEYIRAKRYLCHLLELPGKERVIALHDTDSPTLHHANWLGAPWQVDAKQTAHLLTAIKPDWLVVDHYALAYDWERALQPYYRKLMVIDDLADRPHYLTSILLDQTLGRETFDYKHLVAPTTALLVGVQYALLRPEFAQWREYSLTRRQNPELKKILVNFGGVDKDNVTADVLSALEQSRLSNDCEVIVVMGPSAPHLETVQQQAQISKLKISVLSDVSNMAELMANADLAIGAAGSTTWERCCLGLPSVMVVLAKNQNLIANAFSDIGACEVISRKTLLTKIPRIFENMTKAKLTEMSVKARLVCAGDGIERIIKEMVST